MDGYEKHSFSAQLRDGSQLQHDVYERGAGPPIVLIQELPGIGQETLRLADRLIAAGYRVVLPHLFGPLGRTATASNLLRVLCMRREFHLFTSRASSPLVDWLRALCRALRERAKVSGVGVIGMCLTGNFALTLIGDESVLAAVAAQPALNSIQMSGDELAAARARLATLGPMLGFRFAGDRICSARKFAAIDAAFNDDEERVRLHILPGDAHAVLTIDFVDRAGHPTHEALKQVIGYFDARLKG